MIPVFIDITIGTYNVDFEQIEKAISPKTKAIFLAHTLGNPYDLMQLWLWLRSIICG
jgi:CDP-6-deoxy-D-xylo-4-hexulose-3-dehydrase